MKNRLGVKVGDVLIGGSAPVVVQSMTNTDTCDIESTSNQICELADAGSDLVRITVNSIRAAQAVPEIIDRIRDKGCTAPIIGDFHYNGHKLLNEVPKCAELLDKYRINPGTVGKGDKHENHFSTICRIAADNGKPVRIGVNAGSLDQDIVSREMQTNVDKNLGKDPEDVINECMIISAIESTEAALKCGLHEDQIIISCKSSVPRHLISLYRDLASRTRQPLHLGLTEAGMGMKGLIWSAAPMAVLLEEGIGDTIRVSLTPTPGGDRRDEVYAACELIQSLGLRSFAPTITACPGCGRTTSTTFQTLAQEVEKYVRTNLPRWQKEHEGIEDLKLAVMGCIVNGPGESKQANLGISLPGAGESPTCPVYIDGKKETTLSGNADELRIAFIKLIEEYIEAKLPKKL